MSAQFEVQPPFARCHYPLATVTGSADGDSRSDADYSLLNGKVPHPATTTTTHERKEKTMKENNRVLSRQNARELTQAEVEHVSGNINTLTICSWNPTLGTKDCDTVG
jgi:hypothetical protein